MFIWNFHRCLPFPCNFGSPRLNRFSSSNIPFRSFFSWGLLIEDSFNFYLAVNVFISALFFKNSFCCLHSFWLTVIFLLSSIISVQKSTVFSFYFLVDDHSPSYFLAFLLVFGVLHFNYDMSRHTHISFFNQFWEMHSCSLPKYCHLFILFVLSFRDTN